MWSRNREDHFQSNLQINCDIMTAMILQKTISRFNLFHINVMIAEWVILESQNIKNLFKVAARNREVNFQISFWIDFDIMTAMILQNTSSRFTLFFRECYFGKPRKKKSVEYCSKKWRRAFSELSFELAVALWLHWFWKKQFPDLIYFKLNILIAKWVIWRATKKKTF